MMLWEAFYFKMFGRERLVMTVSFSTSYKTLLSRPFAVFKIELGRMKLELYFLDEELYLTRVCLLML